MRYILRYIICAIILLALLLLAACNPAIEPVLNEPVLNESGNSSGQMHNNTGAKKFGPDEIIKEYRVISDDYANFSFFPACEKGRVAVGTFYRFEQIQIKTDIQISENNLNFKTFDSADGLIERYKNYPICDTCPNGTGIHVVPGKVYYFRILNHFPDFDAISRETYKVDLSEGSDYMTKECNQAPDNITCEDSDGKDYFHIGHVFSNGKKFVDYCNPADNNYLYEFYCKDGQKMTERKFCQNGCRNGVCRS